MIILTEINIDTSNEYLDFRAWHKERKEFFCVYEMTISDWNGRVKRCECNNGRVTICPELHEVVIQQYTGFKDCKGNKIYAGDKLFYDGTTIGAVEFNQQLGAFVVQYKAGPKEHENHIDDVAFLFNFLDCEVRGHIFQD